MTNNIWKGDQLSGLLSRLFFISPSLMALNRFEDHVFLDVNHRFLRVTDYSYEEIVGKSLLEVNMLNRNDYERIRQSLNAAGAIYNEDIEYRTRSGDIRTCFYSAELIDVDGERVVLSIYHDMTERRQAQRDLKKMERELALISTQLEEAKTALRVLSDQRSEEMEKLARRLRTNIDKLVLPCIRGMQSNNLDERSHRALMMLESNLKEILSPFVNNLSSDCKNLTPTEIVVANMVKENMTSKRIAELLGVAVGTVDTHRNNIRKKLDLKKDKTNLRSYLLSKS